MADPQGLAIFPGIQQIESADFTLSHGISPSVCSISMAPQAYFPAEGGTLKFTYGGAIVVEFPDCKVDLYSFRQDQSGQIWHLSILDRRWKWKFGSVSGTFNTRDESGELDHDRELEPQLMARTCLLAMGETNYDVSQMPNDQRPLVEWDHDNPAQMLSELCDKAGCRIVLRLDNSVLIARLGIGANLPNDNFVESDSLSVNPPEKPLRLMLVGGKTRYQVDFKLRAVGQDVDGKVVPIDNLVYKPADGWASLSAPKMNFFEVDEGKNRDLAKATVFRWYRIFFNRGRDAPPLEIPGYPPLKLDNGFQILPIEDVQVQTYADDGLQLLPGLVKSKAPLPAWVFGVYYDERERWENTPKNTFFRLDGFRVNKEKGIVEFSDYMYKLADDNTVEEAELFLRVAVSVRDEDKWSWDRYERARVIGDPAVPTGDRIVKRDEIVRNVYPTYNDLGKITRINTNDAEIAREADYYLNGVQAEYQVGVPLELGYIGLRAINPDGAIQQVSWSVTGDGASTKASRNIEFSVVVPTFKERQRAEALRIDNLRQMIEAIRMIRNEK